MLGISSLARGWCVVYAGLVLVIRRCFLKNGIVTGWYYDGGPFRFDKVG